MHSPHVDILPVPSKRLRLTSEPDGDEDFVMKKHLYACLLQLSTSPQCSYVTSVAVKSLVTTGSPSEKEHDNDLLHLKPVAYLNFGDRFIFLEDKLYSFGGKPQPCCGKKDQRLKTMKNVSFQKNMGR